MSNGALARISHLRKQLTHLKTIEETKSYCDQTEAVRAAAKKVGARLDVVNEAAELHIEGLVVLGEMLSEALQIGGDPKSRRAILKNLGVSNSRSARSQDVARMPADIRQQHVRRIVERGTELTTSSVLNLARKLKRLEKRRRKEGIPGDLPDKRYRLIHGDVSDVVVGEEVDVIITDPPYGKEWLPAYSDLGLFAMKTLPLGGSLVCMTGQSYLPEMMAALGESLAYQWMLAYLTPGGQSAQLWERKVNTFWKPLLWYVNGEYDGEWIGDVCRSRPNDNEKDYHDWSQSESGMADIIDRFTDPGDTICDPFVGGGTTGVAALQMNRLFIGIDKDEAAIETAEQRLSNVQREMAA